MTVLKKCFHLKKVNINTANFFIFHLFSLLTLYNELKKIALLQKVGKLQVIKSFFKEYGLFTALPKLIIIISISIAKMQFELN